MLSLLLAAAQTDRLPPANPVPYSQPEVANVMAPVDALLAAIAARDGAALLRQVRADGGATAAVERADGTRSVRRMSWAEFAGGVKPGAERMEERQGFPAVEVDGDIAMVWAPYTFLVNGTVRHCGTNHYDLIREGAGWKVLNVTWSQRSTGCDAR
ncbi:MAG: hypothetical protein JWN21_1315 [Sphingomonas bacterium]|uniref:hypothetical protein n=1 Tax=Sphingomonas bacterium TaxID=1895847 RepID=UPI0026069B11|nr:hypothetical protein [Sphingomonas bacterium]MDB5695772.1 hypothetical protein [Sphingomonas bacterium]